MNVERGEIKGSGELRGGREIPGCTGEVTEGSGECRDEGEVVRGGERELTNGCE